MDARHRDDVHAERHMPIEESSDLDMRQRALLAIRSGASYLFAPRRAVSVVLGASILAGRFLQQTVNDAAAEGERQLLELNGSFSQAVDSLWGDRDPGPGSQN
jgi:hypothetical protein